MLSNYFQITEFKNNLSETEFNKIKIDKKTERGIKDNIDGLTICQMLRNLNTNLDLEETYKISALIEYINKSVIELRNHKNNFDEGWWPNKKTNFNRSKYNSEKNGIVLDNELLNIKHPVFENLKFLKEKYPMIEEIINEIFLKAKEDPLGRYKFNNNDWNIRSNYYNEFSKKNKNFSILEFSYPELKSSCFYYQGIKYNCEDIDKHFMLSRNYQENLIREGDYDCIIEFGCGFGRNLFYFSELNINKYNNTPVFGGEFTEEGLKLSRLIKNNHYPNQNLSFFQFDYNNSSLFFENISMTKKFKNVLCFSFWSIEQVTILNETFFDNLLKMFDNIKFVHIEPMGWQIDNTQSLMQENHRPEYNKNLYKILKNLEKNRKIEITNIDINYFNFNKISSMGTLIDWKKV